MTIHKFCKEVYYAHYYQIGRTIIWNMMQDIQDLYGLEEEDAYKKQLEILKSLDVEIEILDEEAFLAGEHVIYFDADIVDAISDWYQEEGLEMELDYSRWENDAEEVNMALKHILLDNSLITETEWDNQLEGELYRLIDEDADLEIFKRDIGEICVDLDEFYFQNEDLEENISDVIAGFEFFGWDEKYRK